MINVLSEEQQILYFALFIYSITTYHTHIEKKINSTKKNQISPKHIYNVLEWINNKNKQQKQY